MNVIVPLAGPDFERADGSVKAEMSIRGRPLLTATLEERPWWGQVEQSDLVFVLREGLASRRFASTTLLSAYPDARVVWLSHGTGGAALSAAAGVALAARPDAPVIVDLCDILFEADTDIAGLFGQDPSLGALALTFDSRLPQYSYLRLGEDGRMLEAREKVVISEHASAGVYAFRDAGVFFAALAHSLRHRARLSHQGALFVCPMLNGVRDEGLDVRAWPAWDIVDVKPVAADVTA